MAKRSKPIIGDGESMVSEKFRTTPIKSTIKKIKGLPNSAILYKCAASSYWQFRVFLEGKPRKRSTKEEEFDKAERQAKLIYAEMLASVNASETKAEPTSRKTLQMVANSLWAKNETRIKNGELHKDKVSKDRYVFEKHIKPFFGGHDIKKIDVDLLEQFKGYLADQDLSVGSQLSYINVVMALLKEAQVKRLITHLPPKPRIRVDDGVRGYFDDEEFSKLRRAIHDNRDNTYEFKAADGEVYRKTRITEELGLVVGFMVETYIRPTDLKVIRHEDVRLVDKSGITFLVLEHEKTKRHKKNMVSTEMGLSVYQRVVQHRRRNGGFKPTDYVFMPDYNASDTARDSALQNLSSQFSAILRMSGMEQDRHGKPRTLYSLRHTAIVRSLRKGVPIELIASNARTSTDMIRRFYGSHVDSVLETGTVYVEKEKAIRDQRFGKLDKLISDMKAVSDTPEIYTYSAGDLETEDVAAFKEQIAKSREERLVREGKPPAEENGNERWSQEMHPRKRRTGLRKPVK